MMGFLRKGTGRAAVAVIVLLATQLAFAGQACRAVMLDASADGHPMQGMVHGDSATSPADPLPCCHHASGSPATCVVMPDAVAGGFVIAGGAPLADLAAPSLHVSPFGSIDRSFITVPFPTATVGSPLPSYIVFGRFLS
jgi:hypothetical protein